MCHKSPPTSLGTLLVLSVTGPVRKFRNNSLDYDAFIPRCQKFLTSLFSSRMLSPGRASHPDFIYECGEASNNGTNFVVGEYLCEVTLPTTSKKNVDDPTKTDFINLPYYLTFYKRSLTVRNEISRFLQKNTFGPTAAELDDLETRFQALKSGSDSGTGNSSTMLSHAMAMEQLQVEWVVSQMNPSSFTSGKFTSLREYWRRRLNSRKQETYRIGEAGPHPCEKHSRWRKFAFTHADVQNSRMLRWGLFSLGGATQTQRGHRITVERVTYAGTPIAAPTSGSAPNPAGLTSNSRSLEVSVLKRYYFSPSWSS